MRDLAVRPHRGPAERVAAWVVTGPLGHLYSVLADVAVLLARSLASRAQRWAQRKLSGSGRRSSALR